MTIRAQRLTISERVGQRGQQLLAIGAHQFGGNGGRGNFHQDDVIEAYTVEGVFQRNHALNLMGHDHGLEHIIHGQRRFALRNTLLRQMVGDAADAGMHVAAAQLFADVRPDNRLGG